MRERKIERERIYIGRNEKMKRERETKKKIAQRRERKERERHASGAKRARPNIVRYTALHLSREKRGQNDDNCLISVLRMGAYVGLHTCIPAKGLSDREDE